MASNREKRRRNSTGGTSDRPGLPFAWAVGIEVGQMSDSDKLSFLIEKMCVFENMATQLQQANVNLRNANNDIDELNIQLCKMSQQSNMQQMRIIDLEARSRRNNLIFFNISEPENETNFDCENVLLNFLHNRLKFGHSDIDKIVFQRVHRLGKRRRGQLSNGDDPKPRPIIAGFRDYKWREEVLFRAKNLKGTNFSIQQDFPAEIRTARGKLWQQFTQARSEGLRTTIAYPAKLIVEGELVKDMFPGWGKWAFSDVGGISTERSHQDSDTRGSPRKVTLADYISAAEFVPLRSATTVGRKSQNDTTRYAEMDCSGSADANGLSSSGKQGPAKKSDQMSPMTMFRRALAKDKNDSPNASTPQNDPTRAKPSKAQEPCKSPPRPPLFEQREPDQPPPQAASEAASQPDAASDPGTGGRVAGQISVAADSAELPLPEAISSALNATLEEEE